MLSTCHCYIFCVYLLTAVKISYSSSSMCCDLDIEDYYWREYYGEIPSDAFEGGVDYNGNPTYVGRGLYKGYSVPGSIYKNDRKIYFEFDGPQEGSNQTMILCTQHPENLEWVKIDNKDISSIRNRELVPGAHQSNAETFIGRVYLDGETNVGKVIIQNNEATLYTAKNGESFNFTYCDVLVYRAQQHNLLNY